MKKSLLALVLASLVLTGCPEQYEAAKPIYPQVYNLKELNTEFDDYNPVAIFREPLKSLEQNIFFLYSTNYPSQGKNFDIQKGYLNFNQEERKLGNSNVIPEVKSERYGSFLPNIGNTEFNEYGPNIIYNSNTKDNTIKQPLDLKSFFIKQYLSYFDPEVERKENEQRNAVKSLLTKQDQDLLGDNIYTFASDRKNAQQDIYIYTNKDGLKEFFGNDEKADDKYLSYDYENKVIYFSSNRSGNYDIYKYEHIDSNLELDKLFTDKKLAEKVVKVEELNSTENDTCPYVMGNLMLFASDRKGGKGGYDIYYSILLNNKWLPPKNIQDLVDDFYKDSKVMLDNPYKGTESDALKNFDYLKSLKMDANINTEEDEFRPTIIDNKYNNEFAFSKKNFDETLSIIFSSKRKGGKGGFDLHVGIIPSKIDLVINTQLGKQN